MESAMKPAAPPGTAAIAVASWRENPDCVVDQHRIKALPVELAIDHEADDHRIGDADG
jgi:hypothetical protein